MELRRYLKDPAGEVKRVCRRSLINLYSPIPRIKYGLEMMAGAGIGLTGVIWDMNSKKD